MSVYLITMKDDSVTTLYSPFSTPSVTVVRSSSEHARTGLHMATIPNSEAEILELKSHLGTYFTFAKNQGFKQTFNLCMRPMNSLPRGPFSVFFTYFAL